MTKINERYLAILSTLVIVLGSITPLPPTPDGEKARTLTFNLLHFTLYIVCSFLWARSIKSKKTYLALMIVLTPMTEIVQLPLSYRSSNIEDLMTNMIGIIIGYLIYGLSNKIRHATNRAKP